MSMSPVDETLGVVARPKRASRQRVSAATTADTEETSVPRLRATKRKTPVASVEEVDGVMEVKEVSKKTKRTSVKRVSKAEESTAEKRKKAAEKEMKEVKVAPVRKAPTPLSEKKVAIKTLRRQTIVIALLMSAGVGASAVIGTTDRGQIDVSQVITERNDRITRGEEQGEIVSPQANPTLPDGGLVGLGVNGPVDSTGQPVTASSTEATSATTTPGSVPMTNQELEATEGTTYQATST
jgi:hypothetical protein